MQQADQLHPATDLDQQLRREGWSLHQRLSCARDADPGQAGNGLDLWRQVVAPDRTENFDKRLLWDGLTEARAAWAIDPPAVAVPQDPPWWPLLEALRQAARDASSRPQPHFLSERSRQFPFVHVWRPVAAWALESLRQRCRDLEPQLRMTESAWLDLSDALLERLCETTDQTLWELFNQRRTPGQMLLAHLGPLGDGSGEPIHEAYDAFVRDLLSSGYAPLLTDYPVLGRLLSVVCQLWLDGSLEMLQRLAVNRAGLASSFRIMPSASLTAIELGLSDPHRGGRAVAILTYAAEEETAKVVYKPKDMQVDATYQHYLQSLNEASEHAPLRCLEVLTGEGYGFMEWVEHRPCSNDEELERFYFNAGRSMAILHLLGCTDCHHENLIANGDQLILIDTETLLEADVRDLISDNDGEPDLPSALQTSMHGSVLRSGLLPQWILAGADRKRAFDISALGIQPPPLQREKRGWLGLNSDGMMMGRLSQPCELPTSLPVGLGSPQRLTDFVEPLCRGFSEQLQEAIQLRPQLLEALAAFSGQPRRLVARSTRLYFTIQRQMLEPAALRNALAHGIKLEQLSRSYVLASEKPLNWPMFEAERLQLERLDIPFFEHRIDSDDLPLPEGLKPIQGFMKQSGLSAARLRLELLDPAEIGFQQQLIRGAIAARHLRANVSTGAAEPSAHNAAAPESSPMDMAPTCDAYRRLAFQLGQEIWDAAIHDVRGRPEWLGMDLGQDGETFRFGLIGHSLYSGISGISLLFARLAEVSEAEAAALWRQRAWSGFAALAELADRNRNDQLFRLVRDLPFGISGLGGILLALQLLAQAGHPESSNLATLLIEQVRPERLLADQGLDVVSGVSGLIGPLLQMGGPRAQELAALCGERLLALQRESGGWVVGTLGGARSIPLTGFSHGAAGMAAALATLAQASGEERYAAAARRGIAYERSVFDHARGNWPDLRDSRQSDAFMLSWCHGAPGILLSRQILAAADLRDEQTAEEQQIARQSTLAGIHSLASRPDTCATHLCCGLFGLSSLLRIDASGSNLELPAEVWKLESPVIRWASQPGGAFTFFSVDSGSLSLPGLFTGKAGVALALLEAAEGIGWLPAILSAGMLPAA